MKLIDYYELFIAIIIFGFLMGALITGIGAYSESKQNDILNEEYKKGLVNLDNHKT